MRFAVWLVAAAVLALALRSAQAVEPATRAQVLAALPELQRLAQQAVDDGSVPGLSVAVVHDDEVVYLAGFGLRMAGKPETVDGDTVFQLASCSKPIASAVVAALVGDGKLTWDSRIADIDPEFRLHDAYPSAEVTVADLFAHRSGLPGEAGNELEDIGYDRAEILHRLRLAPPASSFRAGYSYSNFGLTEGAVAAARAAGTTWEDAAEQRLFRRLGMASTSARHRDFLARTNRAEVHSRGAAGWVARLREPDAQSPAGGVSSSARAMAQFLRLQLGNGTWGGERIVEAAALARTHEPMIVRGRNPVSGAASFYGLGWGIDYAPEGVVWSHAGAFTVGARSVVTVAPADRVGIVLLSNGFPTGVPDALASLFLAWVHGQHPDAAEQIRTWNGLYAGMLATPTAAAQAVYGRAPVAPSAAQPASAYVGDYANAYVGRVRVIATQGGLRLKLGPQGGSEQVLRHFDRDLFTMVPAPEAPDLLAAVVFRIGPDGRAAAVTLEAFDAFGLGTLTRAE